MTPPQDAGAPGGDDTYYANCTEVRAAGADQIYRGQPGYASKLDRDGDGVAREQHCGLPAPAAPCTSTNGPGAITRT